MKRWIALGLALCFLLSPLGVFAQGSVSTEALIAELTMQLIEQLQSPSFAMDLQWEDNGLSLQLAPDDAGYPDLQLRAEGNGESVQYDADANGLRMDDGETRIGATLETLLRAVMTWVFRPKKMPKKTYVAADKASYSFFIIYTLVLLALGGVLGMIDMPDDGVRNAMLWVSASIYALFIIRKTQIFSTSCSIFAAFLYLCALEMIPTGILVVSAIIF